MSGDLNAWAEPGTIWLSPSCGDCRYEERTWCNIPQDKCEECGKPWIAFDLRKARSKAERTKVESQAQAASEQPQKNTSRGA